jgi:DNA-binding beta-propeller fold protein YncE
MTRSRAIACLVGSAIVAIAISGCGPAKEGPIGPVFYPPEPDPPRLQYLTTINSVEEWQRQDSAFTDFLVGRNKTDETEINGPYGVALRDGKLYICDLNVSRIHIIDFAGKRYSTLGTPDQVKRPANIVIDADGTKYVVDTSKKLVLVFDAQDKFVRELGNPEKCSPISVAVRGNELFVADALGGKVEVWTKDGQLKRTISSKGTGPAQLLHPSGIAFGAEGHLFVVDQELGTVKEFDVEGKYIKSIGSSGDRPGFFARPKGIAIDSHNLMYVADVQWDKIQLFSPEGQLLLFFGEPGVKAYGLVTPTGLAVDATSLDLFRKYAAPNFEPEYLLVVTNQFGENKIVFFAFGHPKEMPAGTPETAAAVDKSKPSPPPAAAGKVPETEKPKELFPPAAPGKPPATSGATSALPKPK